MRSPSKRHIGRAVLYRLQDDCGRAARTRRLLRINTASGSAADTGLAGAFSSATRIATREPLISTATSQRLVAAARILCPTSSRWAPHVQMVLARTTWLPSSCSTSLSASSL
jgi:hypothetical protein